MKKVFLSVMVLVLTAMAACNNAPKKENDVSSEKEEIASQTPPLKISGQKFLITTKYGNMTGILYDETPIHRDNFIKLIGERFYDGLLFHRVIHGFMIQGGDPESKGAPKGQALGNGGPGYTLNAEINPKFFHKKGALAAARLGDNLNPKRASSGSQFYIVQGKPVTQEELDRMVSQGAPYTEEQMAIYKKVGGTPFLDMQYTVFGEIIDGLDVIDKITAVKTDHMDRPEEDVIMKIELINE